MDLKEDKLTLLVVLYLSPTLALIVYGRCSGFTATILVPTILDPRMKADRMLYFGLGRTGKRRTTTANVKLLFVSNSFISFDNAMYYLV